MIKNVFIDLDNTILDFNKAERNALAKTLSALGYEPKNEILDRYHDVNLSQWKRLERGEITRRDVKLNRYRILFDEFGIDAKPEDATATYEDFLSQGHFFLDGAEELLKTLSQRYRLYLVSNGTFRVQEGRLQSAGITPLFDGVYVSEKVGAEKPSTQFFNNVFADIGDVDKAASVIIGDSLTSDMRGGINAGIKTVWFNRLGEEPPADIKPDYEVKSLSEIPEILEKI